MVYLGVTKDPASKLLILQALTKRMSLAGDCDLSKLSSVLPDNLTGADLSSLVSEAAMEAIRRTIETLEASEEPQDTSNMRACVSQEDFMKALDNLKPSVSEEELRNYELLRQNLRK